MNLLITGAFAWTKEEIEHLKSLGHKVVLMQQESAQLPCDYDWIEGVIGNGIFLHHQIEKFTSLKYIQLTSAGYDRVPIDYVKEHNIKIHNAHGVYSIPMAELAICGVLQLYKQSCFFINNQKEHKWDKHRNLRELFEKTVCIIGCGSIGNECAKRFKAFGCNIIGVDLKPYNSDIYVQMLPIEKLEHALYNSDIAILTVPLTDETKYLFNQDKLSCIKQDGVLVNIARGGIVNTAALIDALNNNLYGAVLDVFEDEPLSADSPLWDMKNVIITPHNSFVGEGNHKRMLDVILNNICSHI